MIWDVNFPVKNNREVVTREFMAENRSVDYQGTDFGNNSREFRFIYHLRQIKPHFSVLKEKQIYF